MRNREEQTGTHTAGSKINDLERGEVGLHEDVDLEVFTPWHVLDEFGRLRDKRFIFCTELLVDDGGKACSTGQVIETILNICLLMGTVTHLPTQLDLRMGQRSWTCFVTRDMLVKVK